jgi:outer membrane immunogenic protein
MKIRFLLVGLLITASATSAMAAGPYIGAAGDLSIIHDSDVRVTGLAGTAIASYNTGFGFNLSGGYNFDGPRLEGEFSYKRADIDKLSGPGGGVNLVDSDITVMSYMVNGYYDFKTESALTPFIGVGIGLLHGEFSEPGDKTDDTAFGYQFTAGVSHTLDKKLYFDVSYRFQGAGSDFTKDRVSVSYNSSNVLAGLRYTF